jgi:hypothetical protein
MTDVTQAVSVLEIVDTAVKIGLGALITGLATYIITKLNHDKDLEKQSIRRRRELLEQIATNVEHFINSYRRYFLVSLEVVHRTQIGEDYPSGMYEEYESKKKEVMEATDGLSSAQSYLLLLGLNTTNDRLMKLALRVEEYMGATISTDVKKSISELNSLHGQVVEAKSEFFEFLHKAYTRNGF